MLPIRSNLNVKMLDYKFKSQHHCFLFCIFHVGKTNRLSLPLVTAYSGQCKKNIIFLLWKKTFRPTFSTTPTKKQKLQYYQPG